MEKRPLISVIVPVYKVETMLPKCVASITAQTYSNLEIILVDDGSPDGCGALCDAYAASDSRIRVIHKENGGLSSARNAGMDVANGAWFAFVDSDDWLEPNAYEIMLTAAEKNNVRLVCAGRYDVVENRREDGLCPVSEEVVSGEELIRRIFTWNHLDSAAWDKLYGRELFSEIRYPQGRVCEDVPTTYRIALQAGKAVLCPTRIYNYFHRPDSITTATVISDKTFHFVENAKRVYEDISKHNETLIPEVTYLYLRALSYSETSLALADETSRRKYKARSREYKKALRKNLSFIHNSRFVTQKERRDMTLLAFGLYRMAWTGHAILKRRT